MPSKYKAKDQKKRYNTQKQDAVLPYKQHYKPPTELEMCPNCGYTRQSTAILSTANVTVVVRFSQEEVKG